jgi:hypothetical protein
MNEQLKSYKTVEQIAKKHRMNVSDIQKQLDMGAPIEHEHTNNQKLAVEIALQHLEEIPDYYTRLKKMEADAKSEHKKFKDVRIDEEGLRDWFGKSRSKEGKPGWVNVVTGGTCASDEPGEGTPKCVSSEKRESMTKLQRLSAKRRKKESDPRQQEKSGAAKPTYVSTDSKEKMKEEMHLQEVKDEPGKSSGKKDACYTKVKSRYDVWPSAYASGALVKCRKVGAANWGTKSESTDALDYDWNTPIRERSDRYCPKCEKLETRSECKYGTRYWDMFSLPAELISSKKDYNITMPHPANEEKDHEYSMARSELSTIMNAARRLKKKMKGEGNIKAWVQSKITKAADYIDTAADYIDSKESKVNEDVTIEDANGNTFLQIIDIIKADRLVKEGKKMNGEDPCWDGYKQVGKKKKDGKEVPNCVPEQLSFQIGGGHKAAQKQAKIRNLATGTSNPNEKEVALKKLSGPSLPLANSYTPKSFAKFMAEASPAWQRKEGKNSEGGLNKKGIASYRKENPGSNLSLAVTTKPSELKKGSKSANRRKSFCSRMSGMKKKLTSAKTANDPNSRINKSLRKWNC